MKKIIALFFVIAFIFPVFVSRSQIVGVSISVVPPYSYNLDDYSNIPNKIIATLTNLSPAGGSVPIWVKGKITNDNGIEITTNPEYKQKIILQPGIPVTLNLNQLKYIFGTDKMLYSGISKNEVVTKGLPAGYYRFCLQALSYADNILLSSEEPAGCTYLNIENEWVEPPQVIQPVCGSQLEPGGLQMVLFSWFKPSNSNKFFTYTFRMVECFPGQSPDDAMNTATYPYFCEQSTITVTSLVYNTMYPPLKKGKTYAFTVTAVDPMNQTHFKNNGTSPVCSYTYGKPDSVFTDTTKPSGTQWSGKIKTKLNGTLYYKYNDENSESYPLKNQLITLKIRYSGHQAGGVGNSMDIYQIDNASNYFLSNENDKKNFYKISKNKGFLYNEGSYSTINAGNWAMVNTGIIPGINETFIAKTDNDGNFSFNLDLDPWDTTGAVYPNPANPSEKLSRFYSIELFNPYYKDPSDSIFLYAGMEKNIGVVTTYVNSYSLNVNVQQIFNGKKGRFLDSVEVYVLRQNKNSDLPDFEGDCKAYPDLLGYQVISKGTTKYNKADIFNMENSFTFRRLVSNLDQGDEYILYARNKQSQSGYYLQHLYANDGEPDHSDMVKYKYTPPSGRLTIGPQHKTLYYVFPDPPESVVRGKIQYEFPGGSGKQPKPLANKYISLIVQYRFKGWLNGNQVDLIANSVRFLSVPLPTDNGMVLKTVKTGTDGSFYFRFPNTDSLKIVENDFHSAATGEMGTKYNGTLERVYRIKVESPYYCSPDDDIKVQPWSDFNAGTLTSFVNSYKLNVTVRISKMFENKLSWVNADSGGVLSGIHLTLKRKMRDNDVPVNEGQGMNLQMEQGTPYTTIVSEGDNGANGKLVFNDLVRSNYIDDCYLIDASTSANEGDKTYYSFEAFYPSKKISERNNQALVVPLASLVYYNSDYVSSNLAGNFYFKKDYDYIIYLEPKKPRVAGRVISVAAPNGVSHAIVQLKEVYEPPLNNKYKYTLTDSLGYFSLNDLDIILKDQNDPNSLIMPDRILTITRDGYKDYGPVNIGRLKWGTQFYDQNISLVPLGINCKGMVWDSIPDPNSETLKTPVAARIKIGDGAYVNTYNGYPYENNFNCQKFVLDAPTGNNQTLTVVPFDVSYPVKTMKVNITKANQWLGNILVNKLEHKVLVVVSKLIHQGGSIIKVPVQSAGIRVLDQIKFTDYQGKAYFNFTNNSTTEFTAKVYPNQYATFVPKSVSFTNVESSDYKILNIIVEKAVLLKGKVTSADDNSPLAGAKVFVDQGNGCDMNFAVTNVLGQYTLYGVPVYPSIQTIKAVYNDVNQHPQNPQTYIGQSKEINIPQNGDNPPDLNFQLSKFTTLDISQLLGFPLEIETINDLGGNNFEITGAFVNLPANSNFSMSDPLIRLPFHKIRVRQGPDKNSQNIPVAIPQYLPFGLDIATVPVKIFGIYNGVLRPMQNVLLFEKEYQSQKGLIKGRVRINDNSFIFPSTFMAFTKKDFYLGNYLANDLNVKMFVPVFKGFGIDYPDTRFSVSNIDGAGFQFKFLGFDGNAGSESFVHKDSLVVDLNLTTVIPASPPLALNIKAGKVLIHHDGIQPIVCSKPISFELEKWKVNGNNWSLAFNTGGISIPNGVIKTGVVDVPFTTMSITPNELLIDKYDLNTLSIAGVVPLTVTSQPVTTYFGYDKKVGDDLLGHYKLILFPKGNYPVATFGSGSNMEGLDAGAKFSVNIVSLISNGEQRFSFGDNPLPVVIHKVAIFKPLTITSYDDYFSLMGTVDFSIPRTPANIQCNLKYMKYPGKAKLEFQPVNLSISGPGGVIFSANTAQVLNSSGYFAEGNIYESGIFNFHAKLYRVAGADTKIKVEYNQPQTLAYSSKSKLTDVYGQMIVKNNDWDNFRFGGTLTGAEGIGVSNQQKLDFVVKGDVCAEGQAIGVKNVSIPGGFSGISLLYDYENSRLTGSMQFSSPFSGVSLQGMANVVFDQAGWYFLAGGKLTSPGIGTVSAGIMFGDYGSFPADMQSKLMQFAYNKNIPCDFKNGVHGFFITGMKTLPISVPNYNVDLGIARIRLGAEAGLDARLYMNFSSNGSVFGSGAMVFAHAYFLLDSYFCTSISADARAELLVNAEYHTDTKTIAGFACGSISVKGSVEQCIGAFDLCGPCVSAGISESLKVELSVDTNQGFHGFSIGTGDCSQPSGKPCQ